jgi:UDPglucose--hexose-1-phosphate uridylyltransferase
LNLARILKQALLKLRAALNDPPYNFLIHTAPFRRPRAGYWTSIQHDYHWHLELIPRLTRPAGFEEGSGFFINPVTPEDAALRLLNTPALPDQESSPQGSISATESTMRVG